MDVYSLVCVYVCMCMCMYVCMWCVTRLTHPDTAGQDGGDKVDLLKLDLPQHGRLLTCVCVYVCVYVYVCVCVVCVCMCMCVFRITATSLNIERSHFDIRFPM